MVGVLSSFVLSPLWLSTKLPNPLFQAFFQLHMELYLHVPCGFRFELRRVFLRLRTRLNMPHEQRFECCRRRSL